MKKGGKGSRDVIALPKGIHAREVGRFRLKRVRGELVYEADFVTSFTVCTAAVAAATSITPANLITALSGTVFAKFYTGSGTGAFARCRFTGVGLSVSPLTVAGTVATGYGAYALIPGTTGGTLPSTVADVLNESSALVYVPPTITAGFATGIEYCSKPSKSLSLTFSGTDELWIDPGAVPSVGLATVLVYSGTGAAFTSSVLLSCRAEFKGFGFQ